MNMSLVVSVGKLGCWVCSTGLKLQNPNATTLNPGGQGVGVCASGAGRRALIRKTLNTVVRTRKITLLHPR